MTTKVTVDAHAGWDVAVTQIDANQNPIQTFTVKAHTVQNFYASQGISLIVTELKPDTSG